MKAVERQQAVQLRQQGRSIKSIANELGVAKSSVSVWVRNIEVSPEKRDSLAASPFTTSAINKRRVTRLNNEKQKRQLVIDKARLQIPTLTGSELWLLGIALYWAEGGKTQRLVRFSNSNPHMIALMMRFFREACGTSESKFRGYIHIHDTLNHLNAEKYWSNITGIPRKQFFKTYRKTPVSSQNKRNSLPYGVLDIYVLDTNLFLQISGWISGISDDFPTSQA